MEPRYRFRLYLLTVLILAGCGTLLSRLYEFQIERRAQFVANIPTTHTVEIREPGVRGQIVDRNGVVLARNRRTYEIVFNLEDIRESYLLEQAQQEKERREAGESTPEDDEELKTDIVSIVQTSVIPKLQSFGLTGSVKTPGLLAHYNSEKGLVPYRFRSNLTPELFAKIAERCHELPGVEVRVTPQRIYPYGALAGHILGYTKQWAKGDIPEEFKERKDLHYQGASKGVAGIEYTAEKYLKGKPGKKILVRNERKKVIATEDYQPALEGAEVQLTIDGRIQHIVENIMRTVGRGAAVVMAPDTGEILAMVSVPSYDPNHYVPALSTENGKLYYENRANPLINRAIKPFIPGSTFKLPTAIAAARNARLGFTHNCIGYLAFGKTGQLKIGCWKKGGHGSLGMSESIQRSCNPYFMALSGELGGDAMVETFEMLGFGHKSGVLLPGEDPGSFPGSDSWKSRYPGATATRADIAQFSIGQGRSLATPLQICAVGATIANGGKYYQPRIVRRVLGKNPAGELEVIKENIPIVKANLLQNEVSKGELDVIRLGMWKAANEKGGTAGRVALEDVFVAAKTGTAQVNKFNPEHTHNAWTVSFAPFDAPRYAICVMVVNGESGGKVAGVLSNRIYREIFNMEAGINVRMTKLDPYGGNFDSFEEIAFPESELFDLDPNPADDTGGDVDTPVLPEGEPVRVVPNLSPGE